MASFDVFEKAPERRRRSIWNRLCRRPRLFVPVVLGAIVLLAAATYVGLRATHALPAQRRARQIAAAAPRFAASPQLAQRIVTPLEQYLTENLAIASNIGPFADFVRRRTQNELPLSAVLVASKAQPQAVIERWREVLRALEERDVPIYGLPQELRRGELWLRDYVATRMRQADPVFATMTARNPAVDVAIAAVDRQLGVSPQELNGILAVADCAQRLRQPASGR